MTLAILAGLWNLDIWGGEAESLECALPLRSLKTRFADTSLLEDRPLSLLPYTLHATRELRAASRDPLQTTRNPKFSEETSLSPD